MGGAHSRRKGADGERAVVAIAKDYGFNNARRTAPMQAGYGGEYPDVDCVGPLWIECKRYRRTPVNALAKELLIDDRPGYVVTLAWKDDGSGWMATTRLSDLFALTRRAYPMPANQPMVLEIE